MRKKQRSIALNNLFPGDKNAKKNQVLSLRAKELTEIS
jgi:hypothetical protein